MKNAVIFIAATAMAGACGFVLQRYLATDTVAVTEIASVGEIASQIIEKILKLHRQD